MGVQIPDTNRCSIFGVLSVISKVAVKLQVAVTDLYSFPAILEKNFLSV